MAELPLLVNSPDPVLLTGNASASVGSNGLAGAGATQGEGFATVLDKQLMPGEGATATESPPSASETQNLSMTETGEQPPSAGKALPPVAMEDQPQTGAEFSALDAELVSVIAPNMPLTGMQAGLSRMDATLTTGLEPEVLKQDVLLRAAMQQVALAQTPTKSGVATPPVNGEVQPLGLLNTTANPQAAAIAEQTAAKLPNAAQDAQRAATLPPIPTMLGKSISSTAEQALERASRNAGKAQYFRSGFSGTAGANTQNSQASPGAVGNLQHLVGSTQRVDMFNAVMGGLAQADTHAESRLAANSLPENPSNTLINMATPSDASVNLSAEAARLPNVAGNGLSSQLTVSTPVGQPAWASELGQRVTWLANSKLREAKLQLHPRSLGAVEVRIAYGHEQQMHVSFSAANPIARDALEASLPRLREMFEQQGLNLADANISQQSPREQNPESNMANGSTVLAEGYASIDDALDTDGLPLPIHHRIGEGMVNAYA